MRVAGWSPLFLFQKNVRERAEGLRIGEDEVEIFIGVENLPGEGVENAAFLGQGDLCTGAVEELRTRLFFKFADILADSRLGYTKKTRGLSEAARLRYCHKNF